MFAISETSTGVTEMSSFGAKNGPFSKSSETSKTVFSICNNGKKNL